MGDLFSQIKSCLFKTLLRYRVQASPGETHMEQQGMVTELLEVLHSVSRGFSKAQSGLSCTPGPAAAPGIRRATRAMANVCTAGSNLVLLNLAPLNSPLLRQGQDEATGSAVLEQPQFVFPPAVSWDSSGMSCAKGQGFGLPRPKRAPQP